jgi:hypothetical protein
MCGRKALAVTTELGSAIVVRVDVDHIKPGNLSSCHANQGAGMSLPKHTHPIWIARGVLEAV